MVLFVTICGLAAGQDYRATVQGLVTDSSDAIVSGAGVTLLRNSTGVTTFKQTNSLGQYRFDFVEPGTYTLTAELPGFTKSVVSNVLVQTRGDVTVDFVLKPGGVTEAVTVTADPVALQFNTSSKELMVDRKQLTELPVMARNPFTLAVLDPAVQNTYPGERNPFYMWAASQLNIGGRTARQNDLLIDGAPVQVGPKGSYTPTMDSVQEFTIQQNSVDAEYGHTAGGIVSMAMREGTNEVHGTLYYFGRNPSLNAADNALTHVRSQVRNHAWGGTVGGPILKNRLFTFFAYEGWKMKEPLTTYYTLPTDLERSGDFSKSLNNIGGLRTIYDPDTTVFDAANNKATRLPFAGNVIPAARIDPTAKTMMQQIWTPNNAGDTITGLNNFKASYSGLVDYWNFSNRTDWQVSDTLKVYGRYSRFRSQPDQEDYTPNQSLAMPNSRGGLMSSSNIAGDAVWTVNANTVINARFSYAGFADNYDSPKQKIGLDGLSQYWPGNEWYMPYAEGAPDVYFPALNIGGNSFGRGSYWVQEPHNYNWSVKVSRYHGKHNIKAGFESRHQRMFGAYPNLMGFTFGAGTTADTFLSPDTGRSGDPYATFLLGAIDDSSSSTFTSWQDLALDYYGAYIQDDFKVSRNLTLNLGLRYEYEGAPVDKENRYSRYLDLTDPIPEMQAAPPAIPEWINQLRGKPAAFNGAWVFADENHRSQYSPQRTNWSPRAGLALRLNEKTALQAGYARYVVFPSTVKDGMIGKANFPGFSVTSNPLPALEGIPQARLSDPFPSTNPLLPVVGRSLGRYTSLGNAVSWYQQDYRNGTNDRFNFTIQRELPGRFRADATFFMHFAHNVDLSTTWDSKPINMADPNFIYNLKGEVHETVPNPFYNYLTPDKFPGALRYRAEIQVLDLLRTYPHYGDLRLDPANGGKHRYSALQLRVQRAFANGMSVLWAYNYNQERVAWFQNDLAWYAFKPIWRDGENFRHRMVYAGTVDLPFGKGRALMSDMHPVLNAILGGWSTSSMLQITSGTLSNFFGGILVDGEPRVSSPTPQQRFNPAAFKPLPAFTVRTAPLNFAGVGGPRTWNLDTTLAKSFPIRERFNLEFRLEAYNLTNSFIWGMPNNNVLSSAFGRCTSQQNKGRQMQYTLRLVF